ncbi:MAG: site-specific DNA-methyltransferase, partial [Pseudomonadota bacterium]
PNPMPESVTDRCTKAHEYLFLLSKRPRYQIDMAAIREPASPNTNPRVAKMPDGWATHGGGHGAFHRNGREKGATRKLAEPGQGIKNNSSFAAATSVEVLPDRNKRSVWTVGTEPFSGAHFATFPPKLIEPCILAGCPKGGTVLDPFGGAGTTGLVAARHGRQALLCELNPEYAALAQRRIADEWREQLPPSEPIDFGPLFGAQA